MALPFVNYAALPVQGNTIGSDILSGIRGGLELGQLPANMKEDLRKKQLMNALTEISNAYAPRLNESKLALEGANTALTNEQAQYYGPKARADIASTELSNKFKPLQHAIDLSNAIRSNSRFGKAYELRQSLQNMSPAARNTWIADHSEEYQAMVNTLANKAAQEQENQMNEMLTGMMAQFFPEGMPKKLPQTPNQANALNNANAQQFGNNQPLTVPTPEQPFSSTQEQKDRFTKATQLSANQELTPNSTREQIAGAIQVAEMMNSEDFRSKAKDAAEYAGAKGKGQAALDALSQSNPSAYENYKSFQEVSMPLVLNRIKSLENMGATDKQREELHGFYDKAVNSMTSNPKEFLIQLNKLGNALHTVAKSVEKSANPIFNVNQVPDYKQLNNNQTVRLQAPNGKIYVGPADKVEAFMKAHPNLKRVR